MGITERCIDSLLHVKHTMQWKCCDAGIVGIGHGSSYESAHAQNNAQWPAFWEYCGNGKNVFCWVQTLNPISKSCSVWRRDKQLACCQSESSTAGRKVSFESVPYIWVGLSNMKAQQDCNEGYLPSSFLYPHAFVGWWHYCHQLSLVWRAGMW